MTQNPDISICALDPSDIAQASALSFECLPGEAQTPSMLEQGLQSPCHLLLVAKHQQTVCGLLEAVVASDECSLLTLAVAPAFRRHGIGQTLLQRLTELAKAKKVRKISLEVRASNLSAQRVYQKAGFFKAGVRPGFYSSPKENAIAMTYLI